MLTGKGRPLERAAYELLSKANVEFVGNVEGRDIAGDRADVIVPAALVYYALARRADADRIHVPRVGVREGIVLELIGDG